MTTQIALGSFVDRHTLRFEIVYPHPLARLWLAVADPEQIAQWFMPVEMEPRVGGRFVLPRVDGRPPRGSGVVTGFEAERLLELSFEEGESHFGPGCVVRFELSAHGEGSRISFTHTLSPDVVYGDPDDQPAGPGTFPPGTAAGWHGFGDCLTRLLAGREAPLFDDADEVVMAERTEVYREIIGNVSAHWR